MYLNYYSIYTIIIGILYILISFYMFIYSIKFLGYKNNNIIFNREPYLIICYNVSYSLFTLIQLINDFKIIECKFFEIITTISIILIMNTFILRGLLLYLKHFFTQIKENIKQKNYYNRLLCYFYNISNNKCNYYT